MSQEVTSALLPARAAIVIVGGGIQGLAAAFELAARGVRDILVLDAGYWQGGASGRNGTLIRGGFSSPEWTRLFAYSNRCWRDLSRRLGHNVMFSRRGYVMVAETAATAAMLAAARDTHRALGVASRLIEGPALARLLPALARERVAAALHLAEGGVAPHHAAMKAYLAACRARGVAVRYGRRVTGFERAGGRLAAVLVGEARVATDTALIAAGAYSPEVAALAGVALAGHPMRIEAMALEPVRPLIRPALALIDRLCYLHQTARGEVVGGTEVPERPRASLATDLPVMTATAQAYLELFPALARLRILRHWAGMLHATPDFGPLLGPHPALEGLWISAGWSYGWAGGPGAGALLAAAIATGRIDDRMAPFAVDRFDRGRPVREAAIVVGDFG